MMPYWVRIALGAVLGLATALALWLLVGTPWVTATAASLLAAIGFLGSYFIWSADRLDEGYEQVLFDRPNTIVSAVLIATFALAGVGTGYPGAADAAPLPPDARLEALQHDYRAAADAYAKKEADGQATKRAMEELRVESDRIALELEAMPESERRANLIAANDALALAMDSLVACIDGDATQCLEARLFASDAQTALAKAGA